MMLSPRILLIAVGSLLAGCAAFHGWVDRRFPGANPESVVEAVDPAYLALTPATYSGPYPGNLSFDIVALDASFPVALNTVGPVDDSLPLPPEQPFSCETQSSDLGGPRSDNAAGFGVKVEPSEYSQHCGILSRAGYYYKPQGLDKLKQFDGSVPSDAEMVVWEGVQRPFVVRLEQGTINRFIYTLAVPADKDEPLDSPTGIGWNRYLLYYFRGGIGIGKQQGRYDFELSLVNRLNDLRKGYAVVMSTGTETAHHYNMWVARNTAEMVKRHFVKLYEDPEMTIGIGESGGAVQQYLFAEARDEFLDALIPVYSYPDVETQIIWVPDCELLEYYFDVTARSNERWRDFAQRTLLEGLSSDSETANLWYLIDNVARLLSWRMPRGIKGVSECTRGWRLSVPLFDNPRSTHRKYWYSDQVFTTTHFDHYDDLKMIYGVDANGFANRVFDNVGVQYGLESLKRGEISWQEFLHLNANIGGWKPANEFSEAKLWFFEEDRHFSEFSMWGEHNMTTPAVPTVPYSAFQPDTSVSVTIAPRTEGNLDAMRAAYKSGHVFLGSRIDPQLPVLDVRHYVDPYMDIHHSFASISTRQRIIREQGDRGNQRIWVAEFPNSPNWLTGVDLIAREKPEARGRLLMLVDHAIDAMRNWLENDVDPRDACFDRNMVMLAQGPTVWDGEWNGAPTGPCLEHFPHFESPRNAAGAPLEGDMFKCELMSVSQALVATPTPWHPLDATPYANALNAVFPDGVCNYDLPDRAR